MRKIKIVEIAKDLSLTHSAVSQWFNAKTNPSYKNMVALNRKYGIPLTAWENIKEWLQQNEDITKKENKDG